jgi:hypothetical protein
MNIGSSAKNIVIYMITSVAALMNSDITKEECSLFYLRKKRVRPRTGVNRAHKIIGCLVFPKQKEIEIVVVVVIEVESCVCYGGSMWKLKWCHAINP